jgi:molybdopterin molybdotransferase
MGSEMQAGQQVLAAGTRLWAAEIGALAVLGHAQVTVQKRLEVAIVATGDEVVAVDRQPLPHQVRESNSWALAAQVAECGAVPNRLGIAPDEPAGLRSMLQRGLQLADVLVTIGGISKGTHDLVFGTLAELGVKTEFHGIDLKPGKPTFFGTRPAGHGARFVFGLPGNPASSFTVFDLLVRPLLLALCRAEVHERPATVSVGGAPWLPNARLQAIPARMRAAATGELVTALVPPSPSGDPFGLLGADHYALIEPQQRAEETTRVAVLGRSAGIVLP